MMNRNSLLSGSGAVAAALCICLTGCSGEEEPEAIVQPAKVVRDPAPPPPPPVTPISELMVLLSIDERVDLPETDAPDNDDDRKAVLEFFDAFVRGDSATLRTMMTLADQMELEALIETGIWESSLEDVNRISIVTGQSPYGQECALAVFEVGHEFEPQLWYYTPMGDNHEFEAALTPPNMMDKLSGSDWIDAWHKILAAELAMADQPDEDLTIVQTNLDEDAEQDAGGTKAPPGAIGRPSGPITPTGPAPGGPLTPTGK
jgi:hypothetical protein